MTTVNPFQSILNGSKRKLNKIIIDKCSEFYNRSIELWLEKNDIETHSTHNEEKSVVAERFIRALKNKTYKYMTSISKNAYTDKLDGTVNEWKNTYHRITEMKPVGMKDNTYNFGKEINDKDPTFKVGDHVRISMYKSIFAEGCTPNWSWIVISKVKITVPWAFVINNINGKKNTEKVYKKEL